MRLRDRKPHPGKSISERKVAGEKALGMAKKNPVVQSSAKSLSASETSKKTKPKIKTIPEGGVKANVSIQLAIYDKAKVDKALEISAISNASFNRCIREYANEIITDFRISLSENKINYKEISTLPRTKYLFKTTLAFEVEIIDALKKKMDPFDLYSQAQIMNNALNKFSSEFKSK